MVNKIKRTKYLINKKLQFQIVGLFLLSVIVSLVVFTGITAAFYWIQGMAGENIFKEYLTIYRQTTEVREVVQDGEIIRQEVPATREIYGVKRWELIVPALLVNNLVIIVMILLMGIYYSHRIAGPLYRMQTDLTRVLDGERGVRIITRKKDKMNDLVEQLNTVLEELDRLKAENNELL